MPFSYGNRVVSTDLLIFFLIITIRGPPRILLIVHRNVHDKNEIKQSGIDRHQLRIRKKIGAINHCNQVKVSAYKLPGRRCHKNGNAIRRSVGAELCDPICNCTG